jgi:hypothetical protein
MSRPVPGADDVRRAILEALQLQPLTKGELARRLAVQARTLSGCLTCLVDRGQVVIRAGLVGLPGQLDEAETMTSEEKLHEQFKMLWQQRGVLAINPIDIEDRFVRERLCLIGIALYGRRGARG